MKLKLSEVLRLAWGNDYVEFFKNIEDAKNNYEMMKERFVGVRLYYAKKSYNTKGYPNVNISLVEVYRNNYGLPY
jgi:hypothetical protein